MRPDYNKVLAVTDDFYLSCDPAEQDRPGVLPAPTLSELLAIIPEGMHFDVNTGSDPLEATVDFILWLIQQEHINPKEL